MKNINLHWVKLKLEERFCLFHLRSLETITYIFYN